MENPFTYYRRPATPKEAQSNVNHWHFVFLGGCPDGELPAAWNVYIREMQRAARADLEKLRRAAAAPEVAPARA